MAFSILVVLLVFIASAYLLFLWVVSLFDVMRSDFSGVNKILWVFLLLAIPPIGAIFYQLIGKHQKLSGPVPGDSAHRSGDPRPF